MSVTREHASKKKKKKKKEDIVVCNIQRFLKERKNIVVVIEQNVLKHMADFGIEFGFEEVVFGIRCTERVVS